MSWTNLFKKSKLKPDPRIRWFGKLPTYPDYYSSPADESWAVEFNDIVLKGFEIYQRRCAGTDTPMPRLPVSGFFFRLPKSGMTAFATLLDFGGDMRGRPFPMCFYAGVPTSLWPGPTSAHMAAATRVIRDLVALRREVAHFLNQPGRFEAVFGEREIDLGEVDAEAPDGSWAAGAKSLAMVDWFPGANSELKVPDRRNWHRQARRWGDNLAKLEGKDFEPTLRFPLAMRLALDVQIAGWIRWLELRMDLGRRLWSLIVSGDFDGSCGGMTVVAREIVPEDFLLFTPSATTVPYLDDLSKMEYCQEEEGPGACEPSEAAADPAGNWLDFVEEPPG